MKNRVSACTALVAHKAVNNKPSMRLFGTMKRHGSACTACVTHTALDNYPAIRLFGTMKRHNSRFSDRELTHATIPYSPPRFLLRWPGSTPTFI